LSWNKVALNQRIRAHDTPTQAFIRLAPQELKTFLEDSSTVRSF
jgi:hypothetical protein